MLLSRDLTKELKKTPNSFYGSGVQECVIPHEFLFLFPFKDAGEIILNKMLGSLQPAWEYFSLWAHDGILSPTGDQIKRMQNFQRWKQVHWYHLYFKISTQNCVKKT